MEEIEVTRIEESDVENPIFIEGLPGVGHVGKLVAEHIVEELESTLLYEVHSHHFPPQCTVGDDGKADLVGGKIHHCDADGNDLLVLTGDHQSQTLDGHYKITEKLLDIAEDSSVERIYTLGGIATGELVEDYRVVGASNQPELLNEMEDYGIEFGEGEPTGGIVGVSGLLLGLGERRGIPAVCLMGETSGYMVDPKSAQAVLQILMDSIGFEVGMQKLEERAEEMEEVVQRLQDMNRDIG
ncbi:MAG: proteasome assembly chaperone family protein, partial [Halobacteria archaeon]|nr:proteasome assembly chaperone family protein [Halobacteria archaeon]